MLLVGATELPFPETGKTPGRADSACMREEDRGGNKVTRLKRCSLKMGEGGL